MYIRKVNISDLIMHQDPFDVMNILTYYIAVIIAPTILKETSQKF